MYSKLDTKVCWKNVGTLGLFWQDSVYLHWMKTFHRAFSHIRGGVIIEGAYWNITYVTNNACYEKCKEPERLKFGEEIIILTLSHVAILA